MCYCDVTCVSMVCAIQWIFVLMRKLIWWLNGLTMFQMLTFRHFGTNIHSHRSLTLRFAQITHPQVIYIQLLVTHTVSVMTQMSMTLAKIAENVWRSEVCQTSGREASSSCKWSNTRRSSTCTEGKSATRIAAHNLHISNDTSKSSHQLASSCASFKQLSTTSGWYPSKNHYKLHYV